MYKFEKTRREEVQLQRFNQNDTKNPSFSSTLLDQIYRSIDEGDTTKCSNMKFYTETTTVKKQISKINAKFNTAMEEQQQQQEANLRKSSEKVKKTQMERKSQRFLHEQDQDVQFFSSTSSSSDSSSGLLSSSDTESMYGVKSQSRSRSRVSCFAPSSKPKPVKTSVVASEDEEVLVKSKSRAVKIYNNLKKVKQPISPGGKLSSFLNSLFTNTKKTKTASSPYEDVNVINAERKAKSGSTCCSSASSFSRSCLSKNSSSSKDNGVKRTVRFYPVSVIVDEDSRPCGHKCLYEKKENTAVKIGRLPVKKKEEEVAIMEKSRRVEEAAREFLREYHRNHNILRDFPIRKMEEDIEDEDEDDVSSCCSSDLFELDHLTVIGGDRKYCEELPVYETTNFSTNRAIANGLIM